MRCPQTLFYRNHEAPTTPIPGSQVVRQVWAVCCPYPMPAALVIAYSAMLFRDWWRIETPYGHVELELDDAGGAPSDERELDETTNILEALTYGIENRDPKITRAVVEVYVQAHAEQFPSGLSLSSLAVRDVDPLRPSMIRYLEQQVAVGKIRLFEDDVILAKIDVLEPLKYVPQPVVPEKTTFIGVKVVDHKGKPIKKARLRFHLPDGDVKERTVDSEGEVYIDGIAVEGMAMVQLIDLSDGETGVAKEDSYDLYVRLAIDPNDARTVDDRFTLFGRSLNSSQAYRQLKTTADDLLEGDSYVDLVFSDLIPEQQYSLEVEPGAPGEKYNLFEDIPWDNLKSVVRTR